MDSHHPLAVGSGKADEGAALAHRADAQAELIILGQAVRIERPVPPFGDGGERGPGDRAADACRGHCRADRLAHHHLLAVCLGELAAIMAGDQLALPPEAAHRQRVNGICTSAKRSISAS